MKGSITASCGHTLADDEGGDGFGFSTLTLGDDCDFDGVHRCSFSGSACQKCYDEMKANGLLATPAEADAWIRGGVLPDRMKPKCSDRDHFRRGMLNAKSFAASFPTHSSHENHQRKTI